MTDSTTPEMNETPPEKPSRPRWQFLVPIVLLFGAIIAFYLWERPEPATPLLPVFEHVEAQDYIANRSLAGRYQPGDVLQIADPEPLKTPILALRSEMCFPDLAPARSAFPLPEDSGMTSASFGITGAEIAQIFPGLALDDSAVTSYRLVFDRPQVVTAPKLEISGQFSDECVVRLDAARAAGEAIEHYATVHEAVIAQGMQLEIRWKESTSADGRAAIQLKAETALQDLGNAAHLDGSAMEDESLVTAGEIRMDTSDERKSVWMVDTPVTLGYRTRPMAYQPPDADEADGEQEAGAPPSSEGNEISAIGSAPALVLAAAALAADPEDAPSDAFNRGEDFVGRLAVQLQTKDGWEIVRPDRTFQTGERFRFQIESSQPAKVFVYHQPPNGERAELWPGKRRDSNHVEPGEPLFVVPPPGAFEMQADTGAETFSVALTQAEPKKVKEPLGNYVLRSLGEDGTRGVGIVEDAEPWLYFEPGSDDELAAVDFQLRHAASTE